MSEGSTDGGARSFGRAADSYERGRPEYPGAAVEWLLDGVGSGARVLDLGAGTGKLTRAVVKTGREVVALDPDPEMLAALSRALPDVEVLVGTAESIPLPDGSVDVVVGGQMWHWVDPIEASAEAGRVTRSGGRLGLIWNTRDERVGWVARMTEIIHASVAERMIAEDRLEVGAPFGEVESNRFEWTLPMTREMLHDMARSRSYVITAGDEARRRMDSLLAELFASFPQLDDGGVVDLPYVTHAYRASRR